MKARILTRAALVLSFGGIFVSAVLALAHAVGKEVPCGDNGGCHTVAAHPSSHLLFGLDNAFLGLAAYIVLAVLAALRLFRPIRSKLNIGVAYLGSIAGLLFSGYLTYVAYSVIQATCVWCLASTVIIFLLTIIHAAEFQVLADPAATNSTPAAGRLDFGLIVGCVLLAILSTGATYMKLGERVKPLKADLTPSMFKAFPLVPAEANVFGRKDAPVTIVEFADLQCPVCRLEFPKVMDLVSHYNGKVRLVFRHYPLEGPEHNMALPAAALAEYAGTKGKFFEFVSAFYHADEEQLRTPDGILKVAESVGLNAADGKAQIQDINSQAFARASRDVQASSVYGVKYTPTFFVYSNGDESKPDVCLAPDLEDLLKSKPYTEAMGIGK